MRLPDFPLPFSSPPAVGASKMSIEEIAGIATPFIKDVDKTNIQIAIQVLSKIEDVLDVTGETGQEVIKRTEENIGIVLSKAQKEAIMKRHPASGLKATVSPEAKGSVRFSRGNFTHVRRFLSAIL